MERIKIKYFTQEIEKLAYIDGKSDWIDLRASETMEMKAGEFRLIPLGVAMELPKGYEAHVVPRSSTFKNYGLLQVNSCGVIDGSYCGDEDMWKCQCMPPGIQSSTKMTGSASSALCRTSPPLCLKRQPLWRIRIGEVLGRRGFLREL